MLHLETINPKTLELLNQLMQVHEFRELNLVGGTALALQIGHRKSDDLDLFGHLEVDDYHLTTILHQFKSVKRLNQTSNIKTFLINGIKVDFVNYPYKWIASSLKANGIRLAQKIDIAAMKLAAIAGRGTKKDFIDIFSLFDDYSLEEMLQFYHEKFPDGSEFMVLKSLIYFEDADREHLPVLLKKVDWDRVKSQIIFETKAFLNSR